ncbi:hypothetical protein DS2_09187 [Catenovulum agarivorans DS-2]|uniref:Peptidase C39-like domain-containing protein n=1 Tax=Catenovulum agarivorans DS-2 TaxID=1328313 RepID=W7QQD4_9ALTE|nr:hypothetical protein [Catenovulum agarivorans]EWH10108.1 hypothetical protein DS2_09187 [Catenovulum agarivorans DS-2]
MSIKRVKPVKQGDLDGACGFYAIVNALKTLEPAFDEQELFTQVIGGYMQDGDFNSFFNGTRRGTIKNTLSRVIDYINGQYDLFDDKTAELYRLKFSIPFWHKDTARTRKSVLKEIQQADNGKNLVCIIGYDLQYGGHWSVVKKVSDKGLHMVDSSYEKSIIPLAEMRVDSNQKPSKLKPYNLCSDDIFIIEKQWLGDVFHD